MIRIVAWSSPGEVRVAAVEGEAMQDYAIWRPGRPDGVGDVYRARVIAHLPALAGSFVELPDAQGFLPDSEGGDVPEGQVLTVQVTRAAQGGKGPRLTARVPQVPGPAGLITRGPGPLLEMAKRYSDAPVLADDHAVLAALRPALGDRLGLAAPDETLLEQAETLALPELDLPGGMRASIYPTPALVAIDLDTASSSADRQGKAAAQLAANRAALPELTRQIRLRNLSGAILVDLAGLGAKRRAALAPAFAAALAADPLRPRFLGFTALGLAEIVRPRVRPPLHELLAGPHAAALAALRALAGEPPHRAPRLRAAPDVLAALEADPAAKADLARRTGRPLIGVPDPTLLPGTWRIERDDRR